MQLPNYPFSVKLKFHISIPRMSLRRVSEHSSQKANVWPVRPTLKFALPRPNSLLHREQLSIPSNISITFWRLFFWEIFGKKEKKDEKQLQLPMNVANHRPLV